MIALKDDCREALRRVLRNRRTSLLAAGTLALGIGAATAVLTMAHTVLLAPPPYRDGRRIVALRGDRDNRSIQGVSGADFLDYRKEQGLFESSALSGYDEFNWTGQSLPSFDGAEVLRGLSVTADYFRVLDQSLAAGRGLAPDEDQPGHNLVVVISYALWQRRFARRADLVGQSITLNNKVYTVVGVTGAGFLPYEAYEVLVWVPFVPAPTAWRDSRQWDCIARLAPGVSMEQAQRRLAAINARLAEEYPATNKGYRCAAVPLLESIRENARPVFWPLIGAVACLLLIAAANAASLLLARATSQAREMAIRAALGAGRLRLCRMMLAEAFLLAFAASAAGALLGLWLLAGANALMPSHMQFGWVFATDARVFAAAFLISALTGAIAGLAPAFESFRLATGGMRIRLIGDRYRGFDKKAAYWAQLVERAGALPGVAKAASVSDLPMGWQYSGGGFDIAGYVVGPGENRPRAHQVVASPGYFATVGIPLLSGRGFTETDGSRSEPVVIVNDLLAQTYWPGQNAVGQLIKPFGGEWRRIVGVVRRVRHGGPQDDYENQLYMPYRQINQSTMFLVLRAHVPPEGLVPAVREVLQSLDPDVPAFEIRTMKKAFDRQVAMPRLPMALTVVFAAMAALLAGLGLFGVVGYWVSQRTRELGIRSALGARGAELRSMVIRQGGRLALAGLALGLSVSLAAMRLLRSLLYGMNERDAAVYAGAIALAAATTLLACWIPAERAARVDPASALREDG